ncbi:DUF5906 domain-containing protein [Pseudomonadales bacterium]|nr:DUF5906 domain-containing protein [Pseudomonadales bacterium]MDC3409622.1 DUF5906 domain-containing protein [bacterium]
MHNFDLNDNDAQTFLEYLDPSAKQYSFRILKGNGNAQKIDGQLDELECLLASGSKDSDQIFVQINRSDGKGQSKENIVCVRALFVDLDGTPLKHVDRIKLSPHLVVETSPAKFHVYWFVRDVPLSVFTKIQKRLAEIVGSDPSVCDLPRIMRLPGTWHLKGQPFQSKIITKTERDRYTLNQVQAALDNDATKPITNDVTKAADVVSLSLKKGLPDGQRTHALTHLAGKLISQNIDDSLALAKLFAWNALNTPPLEAEKIQTTYQSIKTTHSRNHSTAGLSIEDLDQNYAVVVLNGSTKILRETPTLCFLSERDFHLRHRQYQISDVSGKVRQLSQEWLARPHRTYDDVVFDPSNNHLTYQFNLWRGFAISPQQGNCSLYLDHILNCVCNGDTALYNYVINWLAHLIQKPAELPGVALVLIGDQGTGKGSFVEPLGHIIGQHYQHATQMDKVLGRFNMHMANALLVFCDEIVWGGNKKDEGALKGLVTEHDRLVEGKFQNPITLPSYLRLIFATNEAWAVPTGEKERRWCVLKVNNDHIQDTSYFTALKSEMSNGGTAALLRYLLDRDIRSFNVRQVPKTKGLLEQKLLSQDSVATWWLDRLMEGGFKQLDYSPYPPCSFNAFNTSQHLLDGYLIFAKNDRHGHGKVINGQQLASSLKRLCMAEPGRKQVNGSRQRGITLPTLEECRRQYEQFIGHAIDWPDTE